MNYLRDLLYDYDESYFGFGDKSLAEFICKVMDESANELTPQQAIDRVMSPADPLSLMSFCIAEERYEEAHRLKTDFQAIIITGKFVMS